MDNNNCIQNLKELRDDSEFNGYLNGWGVKGLSDVYDNIIGHGDKYWVFKYSYNELKQSLLTNREKLEEKGIRYGLKRFVTRNISKIDEELFISCPNVRKPESIKDKTKDFIINEVPFDLKTTKLIDGFKDINPRDINLNLATSLSNELYSKQSTGLRYGLQNRLFLIREDLPDGGTIGDFVSEYLDKLTVEENIIKKYCDGFNDLNKNNIVINGQSVLWSMIIMFTEDNLPKYKIY